MQSQKSGKTASASRFYDPDANAPKHAEPSVSRPRTQDAPRRPAGFSAQKPKTRSKPVAAAPAPAEKKEKRSRRKVEKHRRTAPKKKTARRNFKPLLIFMLILLVAWLMLALIFGGEGKTIHQLPTIERESSADFVPEETPLASAEVS